MLEQGASAKQAIDYARDIQPLFDRYCVACHACFDAPCQLDLTHALGLQRGANKRPVYDGTRLQAAPPSRLFIDGHSLAEWRNQGFFSVTGPQGTASILLRMLNLKSAHPLTAGAPLPDDIELGIRREHQCVDAAEAGELDNPYLGMPFALPGMPAADVDLVRAWLAQGAPVSIETPAISTQERDQIGRWESWLNAEKPERALVARWLFEHWAIARLYFDNGSSGNFFRLVRSNTPSPRPVEEIATRFANSQPGSRFFYRFHVHQGTRVYKTHITFGLDESLLERIEKLFFGRAWRISKLPAYTDRERSNPFLTFSAIPADARYRFMLEHAEYFVRTFIRGPVCRGQLATDVIRDHFWVMFQAPSADPYIVNPRYRRSVDESLDLPGVDDDLLDGAQDWFDSAEQRNRYASLRQRALGAMSPEGPSIDSIWSGDGANPNALLTVFRHHDSASVRRGWWGQEPLTVWWMDYPLFERAYYNLVVNFDVFGNFAHQAQMRLYFDLIRNGAEQNFLRMLPAGTRQKTLDEWYAGSGHLKLWMAYQSIDTKHPSGVAYRTSDPKRELLRTLLTQFGPINAGVDSINRPTSSFDNDTDRRLATLSGIAAIDMPAIQHFSEASVLRIHAPDGGREIYTLVRNRRHTNVAFVLGESLRYEPDKDELTILPGIASGYPNFIFSVPISEIDQFVSTVGNAELGRREEFVKRLVDVWGVRRSATDFWAQFQDINQYLIDTNRRESGVLDLNRYIDY